MWPAAINIMFHFFLATNCLNLLRVFFFYCPEVGTRFNSRHVLTQTASEIYAIFCHIIILLFYYYNYHFTINELVRFNFGGSFFIFLLDFIFVFLFFQFFVFSFLCFFSISFFLSTLNNIRLNHNRAASVFLLQVFDLNKILCPDRRATSIKFLFD